MPDLRLGFPSPAGNLYVRPNLMAKGQVIHGHKHNFDHMSYCTHGAVRFLAFLPDGSRVVRVIRASDRHNWILIRAGIEHESTALEHDTKFDCIYAHRQPGGEVVQEYTGWETAYV
jgi:hypothetical protein